MKNLEKLGVTEIHKNELTTIDGGNWLSDAWDAVVETVEQIGEAVDEFIDGLTDPLTDDFMM